MQCKGETDRVQTLVRPRPSPLLESSWFHLSHSSPRSGGFLSTNAVIFFLSNQVYFKRNLCTGRNDFQQNAMMLPTVLGDERKRTLSFFACFISALSAHAELQYMADWGEPRATDIWVSRKSGGGKAKRDI